MQLYFRVRTQVDIWRREQNVDKIGIQKTRSLFKEEHPYCTRVTSFPPIIQICTEQEHSTLAQTLVFHPFSQGFPCISCVLFTLLLSLSSSLTCVMSKLEFLLFRNFFIQMYCQITYFIPLYKLKSNLHVQNPNPKFLLYSLCLFGVMLMIIWL